MGRCHLTSSNYGRKHLLTLQTFSILVILYCQFPEEWKSLLLFLLPSVVMI